MFTKRIIPCLDVKNGRVVKGVNFVDLKDAGDPVEIAKAYDKAGQMNWYFWISLHLPMIEVRWSTWCGRLPNVCLFHLP